MLSYRAALILGVISSFLVFTNSSVAFADVMSLSTQKEVYADGEQVVFYGTTNKAGENISVVIRDLSGEFIDLRSTTSNSQGYFQTIPIEADEFFTQYGIYDATAFSNDQLERYGKTITLRFTDNITPTPLNLTPLYVLTDNYSYVKGELIQISGQSPVNRIGLPISIVIKDFSGDVVDSVDIFPETDGTFTYLISTAGPQWHISGIYTINAQQFHDDATTSFVFKGLNMRPPANPSDNVIPLILVPDDIIARISGADYARVSFSVTAIDNEDGVIIPKCTPSQNSLFPLGQTHVECIAIDSSGNLSSESFFVIVTEKNIVIPTWIKSVAGYWCSNVIDDKNYSDALEYLIKNDVMDIPESKITHTSSEQSIPNWIKEISCWWSQGEITDKEFVSGMEYLIDNGIISV